MPKKVQSEGLDASSRRPKVKIVVLPGNVARVEPPDAALGLLLGYRALFLEGSTPAQDGPGQLSLGDLGLAAGVVLPAGLVPRFKAELVAANYRVAVDDRRDS